MYRIPPWLVHVLWGESEAEVMLEYWCISWRRSFIPVGKYLISSMALGFMCCFGDDGEEEDVERHLAAGVCCCCFNCFHNKEVTLLLNEEL